MLVPRGFKGNSWCPQNTAQLTDSKNAQGCDMRGEEKGGRQDPATLDPLDPSGLPWKLLQEIPGSLFSAHCIKAAFPHTGHSWGTSAAVGRPLKEHALAVEGRDAPFPEPSCTWEPGCLPAHLR